MTAPVYTAVLACYTISFMALALLPTVVGYYIVLNYIILYYIIL